MHNGIYCAVFETEDDYSGKMYCKKCGRPGDSVVQNCTADIRLSTNNNSSRSEWMEKHYFSQDKTHCNDMNSSDPKVNSVLRLMETSIN